MIHADDSIQHQIEAYLNQEMSDLDRSRFEKMVHDDPELHEEVELQESMMEAIRAERMLALKAGLSSVNISLWSTGLVEMAKIAAIVVGLGVSGVVGYTFYSEQSTGSAKNQTGISIEPQSNNPDNKAGENPGTIQNSEIADIKALPFESNPGNANSPNDKQHSSVEVPKERHSTKVYPGSQKTSDSKSDKKANLEYKENTVNAELNEPTATGAHGISTTDIVLPDDGITKKSSLESVHPEVIIKRENKDRFHYQFADNKLVLYADFSDKLYEVLELNQDNTKRMFFCYDSKFYQLNPNQIEISPLKEVQDKGLNQILSAYQKRKN